MENAQVDIAHLIRSIQRLEKHPDCFGVAEFQRHCDRMNEHGVSFVWENCKIIQIEIMG